MANTNTSSTWKGFFTSDAKCLLWNEAGDGLRVFIGTEKNRGRLLAIKPSIKANPTVLFMVFLSLNKAHVVFGLTTTGGDHVSSEEKTDVFLCPQGSSCDIYTIALVATLESPF
jgi:hypothetical protein